MRAECGAGRAAFLAALIATMVALAGPPAAGAATSIELAGGELEVIGDAFANEIEVRRVADGCLVRDPRARLTIATGSQCFFTSSASPPHEAKCLRGSEVQVSIEGGAGDDELTISSGTEGGVLDGAGGGDRLVGGPGPDLMRARPGADELLGNDGNDLMNGEGGPDTFAGGPGTDTVSYADRVAGVHISLPDDSSNAGLDDGNLTDGPVPGLRDSIKPDVENAVGGNGNDEIFGSDEANVLSSRDGVDQLSGRGGADVLGGGLGPDQIGGGDGVDVAFYGDRSVPLTVTLDGQPGDGNLNEDNLISGTLPGGASENVATDVEGAIGGSAADTLVGDGGPNWLDGRRGDDTIDAGEGDDDVKGGDGDDALEGNVGADDVSGGAGRDSVTYLLRKDPVSVTLDGVADDGGVPDRSADNIRADIENVTGGNDDDVLIGNAAANLLDGFFGDDRLEGRAGNDTLRGESGSDLMDGGDGTDTADDQRTPGGPSVLGAGPVTVTLDGVANDGNPLPGGAGDIDNALTENVTGSEFNDTIVGNDGPNTLSGGGGDDNLRGGGGDAVNGGDGLDVMLGEAGGDLLLANDGLRDQANCGSEGDIADLDLGDTAGPQRGGGVLPASAGCEFQNVAPAGRLPNVALAAKTVRLDRRRRARLELRCPRRSHRRCAGTVRLQRLDGADLGVARFAIRKGRRATVVLRLRRPAPPGIARILARERDVDGRAKLTLARVRVR